MAYSEEVTNYNNVTDILTNTFGAVLDRDIIYSIVESCCGDLNYAANAIMSITSEETPTNPGRLITNKNNSTSCAISDIETLSFNAESKTDYTPLTKMSFVEASTSYKKDIIKKQVGNGFKDFRRINLRNESNIWTDQIRRIVTLHNEGTRTLIIMRGAPGSGKTHLAQQIQEITVGTESTEVHIFSTDDYFMSNGHYTFDKAMLQFAHMWNQQRAFKALKMGISPVIVDNTNTDYWEMKPYVESGVCNGYLLEVVEPNTSWARNVYQLTTRNIHRVPSATIKRMLETLETPISSINILSKLNLAYPVGKTPPMLRCLPDILPHSYDNYTTAKKCTSLILQQNQLDNQLHKVEDKRNTSFTTQQSVNSKAETCEAKTITQVNDQYKDSVKKVGAFSKNTLDIDKPKPDCHEVVTCDQGNNRCQTEQKHVLNDKIGMDMVTDSSTSKGQGESKYEVAFKQNQENEFNGNDCNHNLLQSSRPTDDLEYELYLKESRVLNSTEIKDNQTDVAQLLEEFKNVENEWDNGEAWEENSSSIKLEPVTIRLNTSIDAKLPRNRRTRDSDNFIPSSDNHYCEKISKPMASLTINNNLSSIPSKNVIETRSTETCMEVGDRDISCIKDGCKILSVIARDININYLPKLPDKIPENSKFDKSSMTNEHTFISAPHRCKNEDKHFIRFRNMFKHIKEEDLRDIFDNCCGDVNWAVSIIIDDMPNNQNECITIDEHSEIEEDSDEPCDCTSIYGITPDIPATNIKDEDILNIVPTTSTTASTETSNLVKKIKKDSPVSDLSLALKRQIEQNIVISEQHYSDQCLKIFKKRRGVFYGEASTSQNIGTGITVQNTNQSDNFEIIAMDNCNADTNNQDVNELSPFDVVDSEYNSDEESSFKEVEKKINVNLGHDFIKQLDSLFGRADMEYSPNIQTSVNMPISLLNDINALWMESLMCQLEAESKSQEEVIKQDEELARALTMNQLEGTVTEKEPDVPNFKEIMDMEFALSLYRKDCEEWMQKDRPTDLASKMSASKLYELFPEIAQDDLDQIFMAYHYNFRATVKLLLETQGRTDITKEENGINKFIMAQEIKRNEKFVAEEKRRLMEEKLPVLTKKVNMEFVNNYREKAKLHLANWNKTSGKAKYMTKNQGVANYYNSLADLYLLKYEQANSIAAVSLLKIQATKSGDDGTLDLHYLYVEEAKSALDVFLDTHIQRHRDPYCREKIHPEVYIITGRGLHSHGGPKIKPAVKSQLQYRGLIFRELNPGMLSVRLSSEARLSYQIP